MNKYATFLEGLGLDERLVRCVAGDIQCPTDYYENPPRWYGYPPALTPIWSCGSLPQYIGYWKHWFIEREPTFVQMYVTSNRSTFEIARTVEQMCYWMAISAIVEKDAIDESIVEFCKSVGITDLDKVDELTRISGDNPAGLKNSVPFSTKTPLCSIEGGENYDGQFPCPGIKLSWNALVDFELPLNDSRRASSPLWSNVDSSSKMDVFSEKLSANDLASAWILLNSRGWNLVDARRALSDLSGRAGDINFERMANAWLESSKDQQIGY